MELNTLIKNYILKPDVMQSLLYGDMTYANLWSADCNVYTANDENVIKTIYDPYPVGFKLSPSNAFTRFTTTREHVVKLSQINGKWDSSLVGWIFYADSSKSKTILFPAAGRTALVTTAIVGWRVRMTRTVVATWASPLCRPWTRWPTAIGRTGLGCVLPKNRERSDRIRFIELLEDLSK